jgi:hypothetical protein
MSDMFYRSDKAHFLGNEALVRIRELSSLSGEMPRIRVLVDLPDFVRVRADLGDLAVEITSDQYASIGGFRVFRNEMEVVTESPESSELPRKSLKSLLRR